MDSRRHLAPFCGPGRNQRGDGCPSGHEEWPRGIQRGSEQNRPTRVLSVPVTARLAVAPRPGPGPEALSKSVAEGHFEGPIRFPEAGESLPAFLANQVRQPPPPDWMRLEPIHPVPGAGDVAYILVGTWSEILPESTTYH